ncbi:hypothetical protein A0H81_09805 [Grifola frondosa]|uniref:Uncharacterized protein n=1 Tax=Grifola frondosa TaxID=5627 RepID=A0A1C7M0V7_GRIFR|nr:hypothetical protein A0H81_09805 [Grifola frondosa]
MPAPVALYVVAVFGVAAAGFAFHQFVYEPHIAPKIETWAESFLERRRQRKMQLRGLVPAHIVHEHSDENGARRATDRKGHSADGLLDKKGHRDDHSDDDDDDAHFGMSIELERLVAKERDEWRDSGSASGLRRRKTAGTMDESNHFIPYPPISPTHVIFDSSVPPSPSSLEGRSISSSPVSSHRSSVQSSTANSPSPLVIRLAESRQPLHNMSRNSSPRLPTPISNSSVVSTRALTPNVTDEGSFHSAYSSRGSTLHVSPVTGPAVPSSEVHIAAGTDVLSPSPIHLNIPLAALQRTESPFSDIFSVATSGTMSSMGSPRVRSPNTDSGLDLPSDEEFDVLSPRSGMFSPPSVPGDDLFDLASDASSWASVGHRSPSP